MKNFPNAKGKAPLEGRAMNVKMDFDDHMVMFMLNDLFNDLINGRPMIYLSPIIRDDFRHMWE